MLYIILGIIIILVIYHYKKQKKVNPTLSVSMSFDNNAWEEARKQKAQSLKKLKEIFIHPQSSQEAIEKAQQATTDFIVNYGQRLDDIVTIFQKTELPENLKKKELILRKEINKHYKKRENPESKSLAIYVAFQHAKLLLNNPQIGWTNFLGLKTLQSNWKAEEYFDALLSLMYAFQTEFPNSTISGKLSNDIQRNFELWNSRNIAKEHYEQNLLAIAKTQSAANKHFIILGIIEYLVRRYQFNPQYRNELVEWCKKDIELYEQFLIEFHEYQFFSIDEQMSFFDNPSLKQVKSLEISFEKIKALKDYRVPRLPSYDVLANIYEQEENTEALAWLSSIGQHIGYIEKDILEQEPQLLFKTADFSTLTKAIELPKSGQKGKLAFLNSEGKPCSTEDAFKEYMENSGWKVMRAEVSFWQAMFCLAFWEEIFHEMNTPTHGQDIPYDLFQGENFYLHRKKAIDHKFEIIAQENLQEFLNKQIQKTKGAWTRLIYNGNQDLISYSKSSIVQSFLNRVNPEVFGKIVYRIAQNPNENRAGVLDFVVWNEQELKMIEIKKTREQIRESQKNWLVWMTQENIPVEIVRIKGI